MEAAFHAGTVAVRMLRIKQAPSETRNDFQVKSMENVGVAVRTSTEWLQRSVMVKNSDERNSMKK